MKRRAYSYRNLERFFYSLQI
ncbi:hypothetical protein [Exiguobacterium sp. s50]